MHKSYPKFANRSALNEDIVDLMMQIEFDQSDHKPEKVSISYQLMSEVGIDAKYQTLIIVLLSLMIFQSGFLLLGPSYYFAIAPYTNCPPPYQGVAQCTIYACSSPYQERKQLENPQISRLHTLGNEFGDYHCQKQALIHKAKGVFSFGGIAGLVVNSLLADNIGRRPTLLLCQIMGLISLATLLFARSLVMAEICLFTSGFGMLSVLPVGFCIFAEILSNEKRQKMEILIQASLPLGGALCSISFFYLSNWRTVFLIFLVLPLIITLAITYFFLQETPQLLLQLYQVAQIRESFRFIAKLNTTDESFIQSYLLSENHIAYLKADYQEELKESHQKTFTYLDLLRFPSLRKITITLIFFSVLSAILYFSPLTIVDQFGFNFYLNGVLLNISELMTYLVSFNIITQVRRKHLFSMCFVGAALCSFALIFLNRKEVCFQDCWNSRLLLELLVFILFRFSIALQIQVAFVYAGQLYPVQVSALGIGLVNVFCTVPNIFIPTLVNALNRTNFSVMIVFFACACLGLCCLICLTETFGIHAPENIEEIHREHERVHKKSTRSVEEGK